MTEANPPAQPNELRRRILFLVAEPHRRSDPPYHDAIAEELNEAEDTIRDQLWILDHQGFVFLQTLLDTLIPNITPEGLLEVEKMAQKTPEVKVSPPASENLFLREGDYWTLKFGSNQPIRLKDSVGLVYIHHLIQHPGRELLAMVLVQQTRGAAAVGRTATAAETRDADLSDDDTSGMGALLDPQAKRDYRNRIKELRDEIEEAERNNNLGAAANAREDLQFLESQLSAAFGLGGEPRPVGSPQEKARKAVSKAIHRAIRNIKQENQHLGDHLSNAIYIGAYVSYRPESSIDWHH